jgi:hypothetical protein
MPKLPKIKVANHLLLPEFCTQITFSEVRGQITAIDLER